MVAVKKAEDCRMEEEHKASKKVNKYEEGKKNESSQDMVKAEILKALPMFNDFDLVTFTKQQEEMLNNVNKIHPSLIKLPNTRNAKKLTKRMAPISSSSESSSSSDESSLDENVKKV